MKFRARLQALENFFKPPPPGLPPPIIFSEYVECGPRDDQGMLGPPIVCDSQTARIEGTGQIVGRLPGEAYENFKERCAGLVPAGGVITLMGDAG